MPLTQEQKQAIRQAAQSRFSTTPSDDLERFREQRVVPPEHQIQAHEAKANLQERRSRFVILECLDRPDWGRITLRDVSTKLKCIPVNLLRAIDAGREFRGLRFVRAGRPWVPAKKKVNPQGVRVVCVEHPEWGIIPSFLDAARQVGSARSAIAAAANRGNSCKGLHWRKADAHPSTWPKLITKNKPVRLFRRIKPEQGPPITDNWIHRDFPSVWAAAQWAARSDGSPSAEHTHRWHMRISRSIKRGGLRWQLIQASSVEQGVAA